MRARGLPVVACALLAPWLAFAQQPGPVETTTKYYEAAQAGRCKEVWAFFSKGMQEHILDQAKDRPEEFLCRKDPKLKRVDARLVRYVGTRRAEVAVILRGWLSSAESRENVPLLREGDAWKVDGPRPREEGAPGSTLDTVDVQVRISPPPQPGSHQVFEARAYSRMSRDALDAVLLDPRSWAATLPSFKAIEPLERTGKAERAQLSLADPAPPVPITIRVAGRPNNAKAGFTSLFWDVEQEFKAPVYMRGEWYLGAPEIDGSTHVKLTIVIDPRHWPRPERLFSEEKMANSILRLEKAASFKIAGNPAPAPPARQAEAQPGDPVEAALKHIDSRYAFRCADVWASLTRGTQENIRAQVRRRERERAGAPTGEKPEEAHCGKSGKLKRGSARLVSSKGDEAIVSVIILDRVPRSRYDLFPPESELPEQITLVREGGAWKVDLPRVPVQPSHADLQEVGDVDVLVGQRVNGLHQNLEATAIVRVPLGALDAALADPAAWGGALPSFQSIERMERVGDVDRVRIAFVDPGPAVVFKVSRGAPRSEMDNRAVLWNVEDEVKAPAYMRGRWQLDPNTDGTTRVTLRLVIDPRHWPEGHFSAERLGNAVRDFEKAARAKLGPR